MNKNELSFTELIKILSDKASKSLKLKFWVYKNKHPDFEEEWEAWQDYLRSFDSWEEAFESLDDLHQEWHDWNFQEEKYKENLRTTADLKP